LETSDYAQVSDAIYEILKLSCASTQNGHTFRAKHIPIVIQYEKLFTNPYNVLRFYDILLCTIDDSIIFYKHNGLEQLHRFLEARMTREPYESEKRLLEDSVNILYKATHWLVNPPEQFKPHQNAILQGWDNSSRLGILAVIVSALKRYPNKESLWERCCQVLVDMSSIDTLCLVGILRFLWAQLSPSAPSSGMEMQETQRKPEAFYNLTQNVCERALLSTEKQIINLTVDLVLLAAKDAVTSAPFYDLLNKMLQNQTHRELLLENSALLNLLAQIFMADNQALDFPSCTTFVSSVLPDVRSKIPDDVSKSILSTQISKLENHVTYLKKSLDEAPSVLSNIVLNILYSFKALQIYLVDQQRKDFLTTHKDKLITLFTIVKDPKLKQVDRINELHETIQNFLEK